MRPSRGGDGPARRPQGGAVSTDVYSETALGESGDWVRHLALAWRAAADPGGHHPVPVRPHQHGNIGLGDRIAWWCPLLHLVVYGLGWPRPDLGLARWWEAGRPTEDERLALLNRWWGEATPEMIDWALESQSMRNLCDWVAQSTGTNTSMDTPESFGIAGSSRSRWGPDSDPMHLSFHAATPIGTPTVPGEFVVGQQPTRSHSGRAAVFVDGYVGWYAELHRLGGQLPPEPDHRSWRVDVVCRPLGWLGCYRRSRVSGRWFAGQHRWHELGIP